MTDPNYGGAWQRPEDLVGTVLNDRFRVVKLIGDGGMGSVYLAEHVTLRKKVALKVLKHELCREQTHVDRFLQEARAASMIAHENVVDIVDFGPVPGGSVFFAMEYLEGEDLSALLRRERRFPWARARELMLQVVRALKAAHARGIIHRDLKPANCFLVRRSDGRDLIKLLDFGIAKVTDESGESGGLTRTGAVFGTAKYMAPEQAMGDPADARTDVYAAAICLYEFLTGVVPFDGDNFMRVLSRHLTEPLTVPSVMAPDAQISPVIEAVIVKALSKRPDDRYQSMAEFEAALMAIGPDGRLTAQYDVGPALIQRGTGDGAPGSTVWLGQSAQGSQGPASQPPEGRGGTVMLDPSAPHPSFEPGGTVRLGNEWGGPAEPAPPALVHGKPEATYMMDGMGQQVLQGGSPAVITRNPPIGAPTTTPGRGATTNPPAFASDATRNPDATVFAVEQRSKTGFILMLVVGAVVAIGGGGLLAYTLIPDGDANTPVAAKDDGKDPAKDVAKDKLGETKQPIILDEPPSNPVPEPPAKEPTVEQPTKIDPERPPGTPEVAKPESKPPEVEPPVQTKKPEPRKPESNKKPERGDFTEKLSDGDISKGMSKATKAVNACKGLLSSMQILVKFTTSKNGKAEVTSVSDKSGAKLSSTTASCVKSAVEQHAKFPKNNDFQARSRVY